MVSNWVMFFLPVIGLTVKLETGDGQTTLAWTIMGDRVELPPAFVTFNVTL